MSKPIKVGDTVTDGRDTGTVTKVHIVRVITGNKFIPHRLLTVNVGGQYNAYSEDINWKQVE